MDNKLSYQPTVSIIIAVKNAKDLLAETLASLRLQNYPQLEVVVIDGASTDGTTALIAANRDIIHITRSEPDQGISDAFNKALDLATGEYINFQGAGDILLPNSISNLFAGVDNSYELVCGKVLRVKEDGQTPLWVAPKKIRPFRARSLLYKMSLPHQGLFTHQRFFARHGLFDKHLRFAMDYEYLLRAYHAFPKTIVKDIVVAKWRAGGVGTDKIMAVFDEYRLIKARHQIAAAWFLGLIDSFTRCKYRLKKLLNRVY